MTFSVHSSPAWRSWRVHVDEAEQLFPLSYEMGPLFPMDRSTIPKHNLLARRASRHWSHKNASVSQTTGISGCPSLRDKPLPTLPQPQTSNRGGSPPALQIGMVVS